MATQTIRAGANRRVLDRINRTTKIFAAWGDEPWVNEGAAVRVSLICFGDRDSYEHNGVAVSRILSDLSPVKTDATAVDLTTARQLPENMGVCCYGSQQKGSFDLSGEQARALLIQPNPNGRSNAEVVRRAVNGRQLVQRSADDWVIDFGLDTPETAAALYEAPFKLVTDKVRPERISRKDKGQARRWWLHARPSPVYRQVLRTLPRYIVSPAVSKHRLFVWLTPQFLADHQLLIFGRSDDVTFGILHSRFHELWALGLCTWFGAGNDPRYTPGTTFETFPFPAGMTPVETAEGPPTGELANEIARAAVRLDELRNTWLNPPEWVDRIPETVPGVPERIAAKPGHEDDLKGRTLTRLYNERPAWLVNIHEELDRAVAAAYGWRDYSASMGDEEILRRLLALNQSRSVA